MTPKWLCVVIAAAVVAVPAAPVSAADRPNDKAVEQQGKQIKEGFEIWKKALERGNLQDAVLRSAAGTIDAKEFLKVFAKDIDTFNDRFKKTKTAGSEALALLRRASAVERRVLEHGGISTPAEWAALSTPCRTLAEAYGTEFPIESMEATATRLSDEEMVAQLKLMQDRAKRVKGPAEDAVKKAAPGDKAARETLKREFDSIARFAGDVAGKVEKGEAATVQVSQLLAVTASAQAKLESLDLKPSAKNDWTTLERAATFVAREFRVPWGK